MFRDCPPLLRWKSSKCEFIVKVPRQGPNMKSHGQGTISLVEFRSETINGLSVEKGGSTQLLV